MYDRKKLEKLKDNINALTRSVRRSKILGGGGRLILKIRRKSAEVGIGGRKKIIGCGCAFFVSFLTG